MQSSNIKLQCGRLDDGSYKQPVALKSIILSDFACTAPCSECPRAQGVSELN